MKDEIKRKGANPRHNAKTEEHETVSIHDQDTAELEIPEQFRNDANEKAA